MKNPQKTTLTRSIQLEYAFQPSDRIYQLNVSSYPLLSLCSFIAEEQNKLRQHQIIPMLSYITIYNVLPHLEVDDLSSTVIYHTSPVSKVHSPSSKWEEACSCRKRMGVDHFKSKWGNSWRCEGHGNTQRNWLRVYMIRFRG